jgi:Uma2 family endonuclease
MTQAKPRFRTIEDFLNYDDGTDTRYELVNGELVELPTENPINTMIARFLLVYFIQMGLPIEQVGDKQQIAVISPTVTAREPDLTVHSEESAAAILTQNQALLGLDMPNPLLVIEVVSSGDPGTKNYDRDYIEKRKEYAMRGIPEYWLIDPSRRIVTVLSLNRQKYKEIGQFRDQDPVVSPTFPEFKLTAEQILKAGR